MILGALNGKPTDLTDTKLQQPGDIGSKSLSPIQTLKNTAIAE